MGKVTVMGWVATRECVSVVFMSAGRSRTLMLRADQKGYTEVCEKLRGKPEELDAQELLQMMDAEKVVEAAVQGSTDFVVKDGVVLYKGRPLQNALGVKLLEEINNGFSLGAWFEFAKKVLTNPSATAVNELCLFIESGHIALCPDGDFLAYKKVRDDFLDIYSGTMDNSPGQVLEMERNRVDDNRDRTCSYGLHFCSYNYLSAYGTNGAVGEKVVLVKINPADVVSIPSDYSNTKGRTCRYEVIAEVEDWSEDILKGATGSAWVSDPETDCDYDDYYDDYDGYADYDDDDDDDDYDDDYDFDGCDDCDCEYCTGYRKDQSFEG